MAGPTTGDLAGGKRRGGMRAPADASVLRLQAVWPEPVYPAPGPVAAAPLPQVVPRPRQCARVPVPAPRPVGKLSGRAISCPSAVIAAPPMLPELPYTLGSGDRLRIVVFGQEGLTSSYAVDANGNITMPLIGLVPAQGATTHQLAGAIAARLRQGFIREPSVAVEIEIYRPFFILGEVVFPWPVSVCGEHDG